MAMLHNIDNRFHQWILRDEDQNDVTEEEYYGKCFVCETAIPQGSPTYICSITDCTCCPIYGKSRIHKRCGELPTIIKHPMHQHGLLEISYGDTTDNPCNGCWQEIVISYYYRCCNFILCIRCALMEPMLVHQGHVHSLSLVYRQTLSACDACGTEARDCCYLCVMCQFWIHRTCFFYPLTLKLRIHVHNLELIYSLPEMYHTFRKHCSVCRRQVIRRYWVYFCRSCGYFVHLKCAIGSLAAEKSSEEVVEDEKDFSDFAQFPLRRPDMVLDLVTEYQPRKRVTIKEIKEEEEEEDDDDDDFGNKDCIIWHWSHKVHPLFLLEEFKENSNGIEINDEMLVCNGCVQPISPSSNKSYYGCIGCSYFLHTICAKHLPLELPRGRCPYNPKHSLKLCNYSSFLNIIWCSLCYSSTNGFIYSCKDCQKSFCCFRPNKVKHDCHKHPLVLVLRRRSYTWKDCNACLQYIVGDFEYGCESCDEIHIHVSCAMFYPKTMSHRWDQHNIPLMYPPIFYEGLKYCEKCEGEVNPEGWLYHCLESEQTFHLRCIRAIRNVKVGHAIDVPDHHPHTLTFVVKPIMEKSYVWKYRDSHRYLFCRKANCHDFGDRVYYLECGRCDYLICTGCCCDWLLSVRQQPSLMY